MQPFDDKVPEEMDTNNTAMIAFLGHVYVRDELESDAESKLADTEEMQAVVRVRKRLYQLTQESPIPGMHMPIGGRVKGSSFIPQAARGWQQHMKVLALVAILVLLIGSSFFITNRVQQSQRTQSIASPTATSGYIVRPSKSGSLLIGDMLQADQVSRSLLQSQQFIQLNQSQVVDGYQVTLDRAYMDANIVLLGIYAVMPYGSQANQDGQKDRYFLPADGDNHIRLTTAEGVKLPSIGNSDARDISNIRHEQRGVLLGFDGADIQGDPSQVALNLQMDVHCQGWPPDYKCMNTVNFSFTLPVHAATRIAAPQEAATQNGKTFTLERVVITPAEARFYIGGWAAVMPAPTPVGQHTQQESYDEIWYNIKLSVANKTYNLCTLMTPLNCPQGARTGPSVPQHPSVQFNGDSNANAVYLHNDQTIPGFSLLEPFNEHGKMTVTITKKLLHFVKDTATNNGGYVADPNTMSDDKNALPWVIEFTLP